MSVSDSLRRLLNSPSFKFILIIVLILALTVPLLFAFLLINERQQFARQAHSAIGRMWSGAQTLHGPYVVVPTTRVQEVRTNNGVQHQTVREIAVFLPEELKIAADVKSEIRRRGIFNVPVYRSVVRFDGKFIKPVTRAFAQSGIDLQWGEAALVLTLDDVRGIKKTAELIIDGGGERQMFRAGNRC